MKVNAETSWLGSASASERVLLVSPHADDEWLAAGGALLRLAAAGARIVPVLCAGSCERWAEFCVVAERYTAEEPRLLLGRLVPDSYLDQQPMAALVGALDALLLELRPRLLLMPGCSHHQDHAAAHRACAAACRASARHLPPVVVEFNYPPRGGENLFVDVGSVMERKLELWGLYESQNGRAPFYTAARLEAEARALGLRAGCKFAEAFVLRRAAL